ncbi:MAG: 4-(cytidine 5'-diphospho)-2-C-methyl-D-erythritol kinase [Lachnospiraceae bacterium]|nr:4-(cytidine 5'-diphospho)-2-C-methyl-D-erythritol kinase [Lachnospiraceae bacterium]
MRQIALKAYAKINLGLDVLRRREDNYHEVRMVMQSVTLYDKLTMKKISKDEISLSSNLGYLPNNDKNLVYKAIHLMREEYKITQGVKADLEKRIPVAAGLAGGSTDAAAALVGMNRLFHLKLSLERLMELGAKIGADVPYCVLRGTALSEGIGEILTPLSPLPACYILLAKPGINVSTRFVYENLEADKLPYHPDIDGMIEALEREELKGVTDRLSNVLETVTEKKYPIIGKIKQTMKENGALNSIMSGSGPTVFGIFDKKEKAEKALDKVREIELVKNSYLVEPFLPETKKYFLKR